MQQLIDKTDFIGVVKFSANIPAVDVNFHCLDAQNFDVYPVMPLVGGTGSNLLTDYADAILQSPVTRTELVDFFDDFLKPFMVCKAAARFMLWHGRNVTQYALTEPNQQESTPVTDKARAELIADIEHKANVYLARFNSEFVRLNYTFDSVVYSYGNCQTRPKAKTRVYSI